MCWGLCLCLLATFLLTIFRDLTEAIIVGFALGSVLFIHRMSKTTAVESQRPYVAEDEADYSDGLRTPYEEEVENDPEIVIYRISGVFFFGAAASIGSVLDQIADTHRALIIDFSAVPFVDSTAANTIEVLAQKAGRRGVSVYLSGAMPDSRRDLVTHGLRPPLVRYSENIESAVLEARAEERR